MRAQLRYRPDLGHAYAVSGKREEAQKVIGHLRELSVHQYVAPYNVAVIYAGLGEKDEAFAGLNRAYQERSYLLTYLTVDERLDKLHSDPRFDELVRRLRAPRAKVVAITGLRKRFSAGSGRIVGHSESGRRLPRCQEVGFWEITLVKRRPRKPHDL